MACSTCRNIAASLTQYEASLGSCSQVPFVGPRDFFLGSSFDLERRLPDCESCRSILGVINPVNPGRNLGTEPFSITVHFSNSSIRLFLLAGDLEGVAPTDFRTRRDNVHRLSHTPCYSTVRMFPNEARGREYNTEGQTVSIELIKRWIHRCDTAHQQTCVRKYDLYLLPTARLSYIDTQDLCIVTPDSEVRYAALSYVWGTLPVLRALKSNLEDLRRPGVFSSAPFRLPRTIGDAVTLCSQVGIRYIWVDSLCIVQDDPTSQQEQLRAMGSVYGKAYFTITALESTHAGAGIYRVGQADVTYSPQDIVKLPSRPMIVASSRPAIGLGVLSTPGIAWNTRAWTLQEHVFSRRMLAMGKVATWVCFGDQWTEDVEFATELDTTLIAPDMASDYKLGPVTWPSIRAYAELATEYATRDLTYSSDTINAFSGILTPMAAWFPGGLLYGIAEFTFDAGLLWTPRRHGASLRCDSGTTPLDSGSIEFPTWSWISWKGALQFNLWGEGEDYSFPRGPLIIRPLVRWQKCLESTNAWVDVDNSYHRVRAHFDSNKDPPPSIPDGWTKQVDEASGESYYQHSQHGHVVPNPRFSYPIPPFVRPRDMDQEAYHPYLRFRGVRAHIKLSIDQSERMSLSARAQEGSLAVDVDTVNCDGKWAGRLTLNLQKGESVPEADETIEVIAISESTLYLQHTAYAPYIFREVTQRDELAGLEAYEMVNVLWIGWCSTGMAYRKAVGRVWKPVWVGIGEVELLLT